MFFLFITYFSERINAFSRKKRIFSRIARYFLETRRKGGKSEKSGAFTAFSRRKGSFCRTAAERRAAVWILCQSRENHCGVRGKSRRTAHPVPDRLSGGGIFTDTSRAPALRPCAVHTFKSTLSQETSGLSSPPSCFQLSRIRFRIISSFSPPVSESSRIY